MTHEGTNRMDFNELFDATIVKVDNDCYDVTLKVRSGLKVAVCNNGYDEVTMKVRDVIFPKIGSRVMIGGNLYKVKDIDIDANGNIFIIADTGEKVPWA